MCSSYMVNSALTLMRHYLSDRFSAAEQTNFIQQSQQVRKPPDIFASTYRLHCTKHFNTSFVQKNLSEQPCSPRLASNQGAYEFFQKLTYFSVAFHLKIHPCKQFLCHLSLVCLFSDIHSSKHSTYKCLFLLNMGNFINKQVC